MRLIIVIAIFVGAYLLATFLPVSDPLPNLILTPMPTAYPKVDKSDMFDDKLLPTMPSQVARWESDIRFFAGDKIPVNYFAAVMWKESCGYPNAKSKNGNEIGLMQINSTLPDRPSKEDLFVIETNLWFGKEVLRDAARYAGGFNELTYIGYNWGVGNVDRHGFEAAPEKTKQHSEKMYRVALGKDVWNECRDV